MPLFLVGCDVHYRSGMAVTASEDEDGRGLAAISHCASKRVGKSVNRRRYETKKSRKK